MLPIKPHIWFSAPAKEAAEFYATLLPGSAVNYTSSFAMPGGGECEFAEFTVGGQSFLGIYSGQGMPINPSVSFMINFDPSREPDAAKHIDAVWEKLTEGGSILMPLDSYPFSERYGWVADKYGVSWQLILSKPEGELRPVIVPSLLFTPPVAGKADEAIAFYTSACAGQRGVTAPRPEDMGPDKAGTLLFADFYIDQTWLAAMDSAHEHGFNFNDAVSLLIACETQKEIDHYWSALSEGGEPGQCGWLKDKYGLSWQVTSTLMLDVLKSGDPAKIDRTMAAFMTMQKVEVDALRQAFTA